jgi:hypothetical protein
VEQAQQQGMQAQIPPRKNRKEPGNYDKHLYKCGTRWKTLFCISNSMLALWLDIS